MKTNYFLLLMMSMLVSCVELPNLLPNGSGEDSDMVIVEYNDYLNNVVDNDTLVVDDMLSIRFHFNTPGTSCNGEMEMHMIDGHILKSIQESEFEFLSEGDLVGGVIEGAWGNNIAIYGVLDFYAVCITNYYLPEDSDAIVGIRFKDDENKWHYGWVVYYLDTTGSNKVLYLKAVGYNKLPGTNVRIGG